MAFLLYKWLISLHLFGLVFAPELSVIPSAPHEANAKYHPFYVSVTEVAHNEKDKTLEISFKIFTDDLEATLKQNYKTLVDLSDEKKQAQNGTYINDYINKHLKITVDGKAVKFNYVGYEKDSEVVYCYFEVLKVPSVKKLDIENSVLQDYTSEQINIMHVTVKGKRQSFKLDFPNKKANFNF